VLPGFYSQYLNTLEKFFCVVVAYLAAETHRLVSLVIGRMLGNWC